MSPIVRAGKIVLILAVVLLLWEYGAPLAGIPGYVLPVPSVIAAKFWATRVAQLSHILDTTITTLLGLALALIVGVFLALAVVYFRTLRALMMPILAAFNGIPKIAIAPLLVIWFGLEMESKVVMAFLLAMFPIFVNSVTGLGEIEPDIIDLARLSGGTRWRILPMSGSIMPRPISWTPCGSPFPWHWWDRLSVSSSAATRAWVTSFFPVNSRSIRRWFLRRCSR
jgi:NitT/TauT family transport system permease protein